MSERAASRIADAIWNAGFMVMLGLMFHACMTAIS